MRNLIWEYAEFTLNSLVCIICVTVTCQVQAKKRRSKTNETQFPYLCHVIWHVVHISHMFSHVSELETGVFIVDKQWNTGHKLC